MRHSALRRSESHVDIGNGTGTGLAVGLIDTQHSTDSCLDVPLDSESVGGMDT
jgi:hypothetical protein